jgi:xanthine dehydrogenase accessory factor
MRDILDRVRQWHSGGVAFGLATVVDASRSVPRSPGAAVVVDAAGTVFGSVSGGCVEADVYERARAALDSGEAETAHFGYSDDDAFAVGLTCGGELDVFVERVESHAPHLGALLAAVDRGDPAVLATVVTGGRPGGHLVVRAEAVHGDPADFAGGAADVVADARALLRGGQDGLRRYPECDGGPDRDLEVFLERFAPPPNMLIFGAVDHAAALAEVGRLLGFHVVVCDARSRFATAERFPAADEVVVDWPHRYLARVGAGPGTAVCVLTHDAKFDVPLLREALRTQAGYIGVMGSRGTWERRRAELVSLGVPAGQLARLRAPIGLHLGARTPEETALSIGAEIVALRAGGTGAALSELTGPIHHRTTDLEHTGWN